jgi:uncharacterized alpha-E superfamily protein
LSSLLARFAENIFWLARYLERAENLARIVEINKTYARDNPDGPDWKRLLALYGDTERFAEKHEESDARSILNFYVLDRSNPGSIISCITSARENARSVRHLVSTEMWTHLNILHAKIAAFNARDIRPSNLSLTSSTIISGCQTFEGIAEGTFFRSEPWAHYHLGKYLERADQTTRILDMGCERLFIEEGDAVAWVHWNVMLRSVSGYHAFCACHPAATSPHDIADFLLYDSEFPRAVVLCATRISERLRDIEVRYCRKRSKSVALANSELAALLERRRPKKMTAKGLHLHLDRIQKSLAQLSDAIGQTYFNVEPAAG